MPPLFQAWFRLASATPRPGHGWRTGLMLAAFAVVVQSLFLLETADVLLFRYPIVDAATYLNQALAILAGKETIGAFWQPPGYPYFLAGLCRLFGTNIAMLRGVQALLLAPLGALLIWRVGLRLLPPTWASGAAMATCVTGPLLFYDSQFLAAAPASLLVTAVIWLALRALERPGVGRWLAVGVTCGLAMLFVATTAALLPVLVLFAVFTQMGRADQPDPPPSVTIRLRRAGSVFALLIGALLVVAPVTLRNHAHCGRWVLISANSGTNFYIGNSRNWQNTLTSLPELDWNRLLRMPYLLSDVRAPVGADEVFQQLAWQEARMDPAGFAERLLRKALVFWHGREIPRNIDIYGWRKSSLLLSATIWQAGLNFPCGWLVPFALIGAGVVCRRREGLLLTSATIAFGLLVALYFPCSRYRVPVLPLVVVLACAGGWALQTALRTRQGSLSSRRLVLLCAAGVAANLPLSWPTDKVRYEAHTCYALGMEASVHGDPETAKTCLQLALQLNPQLADAQRGLGTLYTAQGDFPHAEAAYAAAITLRPDYDTERVFLAKLLADRHQYELALQQLICAEESNPLNAEAFFIHASLLLRMGRGHEAVTPLNRAAVFNSDYLQQYCNLEETLARTAKETNAFLNALSR